MAVDFLVSRHGTMGYQTFKYRHLKITTFSPESRAFHSANKRLAVWLSGKRLAEYALPPRPWVWHTALEKTDRKTIKQTNKQKTPETPVRQNTQKQSKEHARKHAVCVGWLLLSMESALACNRYIQWHSIGEQWFFFSFLAGINCKQLLVWGQTLRLLPLFHAGTFVWFEPVQAVSMLSQCLCAWLLRIA